MTQAVIASAVAEAQRRRDAADADLSAQSDHYARVLPEVCEVWGLTVTAWLPGGATAPPLAVTTADGQPAVLKVQPPTELDVAVRVLSAAAGAGYVRVLDWDAERGALLLERLGADLWQQHRDLAGQARVIAPLLRQAWQVPLAAGEAIGGKAAGLLRLLAEVGSRYGTSAPRACALAARYASELAADEAGEVVCHGDPHGGNVLRRGDGWALIDCDGFVGQRAYDLGVVLRDACHEFERAEAERPGAGVELLETGCRLLAELADVDAERVWRWGFVERVTTGLSLHWLGHPDDGDRFLRTAETVAGTVGRAQIAVSHFC